MAPARPLQLAPSSLLGPSEHQELKVAAKYRAQLASIQRPILASEADAAARREAQARSFYQTDYYRSLRQAHPVDVTERFINGVRIEEFVPILTSPIADRILINLHGGGFEASSRIASHLESIPVASTSNLRVISVDYRMAPEHSFPAASEDVAAVYKGLLQHVAPHQIGIFGCSAGGLLTAQAIAWFREAGLPLPAAVGMFSAGAAYYGEGDSGYFWAAMTGSDRDIMVNAAAHPYFHHVSNTDPLVLPLRDDRTLADFPPCLIITSTRDQCLSTAVQTHSKLRDLGITTELHVWEGLDHAFHYFHNLPQSKSAYRVIDSFFRRHLQVAD